MAHLGVVFLVTIGCILVLICCAQTVRECAEEFFGDPPPNGKKTDKPAGPPMDQRKLRTKQEMDVFLASMASEDGL